MTKKERYYDDGDPYKLVATFVPGFKDNAEREMARLKRSGYDVEIETVSVPGATRWGYGIFARKRKKISLRRKK